MSDRDKELDRSTVHPTVPEAVEVTDHHHVSPGEASSDPATRAENARRWALTELGEGLISLGRHLAVTQAANPQN